MMTLSRTGPRAATLILLLLSAVGVPASDRWELKIPARIAAREDRAAAAEAAAAEATAAEATAAEAAAAEAAAAEAAAATAGPAEGRDTPDAAGAEADDASGERPLPDTEISTDDAQPAAVNANEPSVSGSATDVLHAFADPTVLWGEGIEAEIEKAYRESFQTYVIDGQIMTLRMPFAQNNEREALAGTELIIHGDGKADPTALWREIDAILKSRDFGRYVEALGDGREKVIIFDLPSRTWRVSRELFDLAGMRAGSYRGLPHRPYVHVTGAGIGADDVYNYLYSVGRLGMDCSGFVWHILASVAEGAGIDLGTALARTLGVRGDEDPSFYVGTQFFDSNSRELIQVEDRIANLRPLDVMLFRSHDGRAGHSAIIQSINLDTGVIRYLQSTDEAPQEERGVHESFIYFDPERPQTSLSDPSLDWTQDRFAPFPGEYASAFSNDGERFRADFGNGGGKVVRLKALADLGR